MKLEIKGQSTSQPDVGVVTFSVELNNGSIYSPGGSASVMRTKRILCIYAEATNEKVEKTTLVQSGNIVTLNGNNVRASRKYVQ